MSASALLAEQSMQFALPTLEGGLFSLQDELAKGPVVLDFWATWCKPCIKALPEMQRLAKDYAKHKVGVFTINVDGPRNFAKIRPFMHRHKIDLPVLIDQTNQIMQQFHIMGLPAALIISAEGNVVYKHLGYKRGDEKVLRERMDELLGIERLHSK